MLSLNVKINNLRKNNKKITFVRLSKLSESNEKDSRNGRNRQVFYGTAIWKRWIRDWFC